MILVETFYSVVNLSLNHTVVRFSKAKIHIYVRFSKVNKCISVRLFYFFRNSIDVNA